MQHKKVIITGATGFIGCHLTKNLINSGFDVGAIVRENSDISRLPKEVECFEHDGTTKGLIDIFCKYQPEAVFHLASKIVTSHRHSDIDDLIDSNLRLGLQLLEAAKLSGCKNFINTGTGWQHYEDKNYNPVCLYAATKQAFESLIEYYSQTDLVKVVTIKLHDNYGLEDHRGKLMSLLLNAAKHGNCLDLSLGMQKIDLLNVSDVVDAFVIAYNICCNSHDHAHKKYMIRSEKPISIRELANTITKVTGSEIHAKWGARAYREREVMTPSYVGDVLPGWKAKISLEEGIAKVWDSMEQKLD